MEQSAEFDYRPMDYGEVLDRVFVLYKSNWRSVLGLTFPVLFPSALLVGLANIAYQWAIRAQATPGGGVPGQAVLIALAMMGFFAATGLHATLTLFVQLVLVHVGSELYLGNEVAARDAFRFGVRHIIVLLVTMFIVTTAATAGFLALVIPGVLVSVYWTLVIQTVAIEEKSFLTAMSRSWRLVDEYWWHTAIFVFLLGLLVYALELVIVAPSQILTLVDYIAHPEAIYSGEIPNVLLLAAQGIFSAVAAPLIAPVGSFALTLYYYDLRARKEGFDLITRARRRLPAHVTAE